MYKTGTIAVTNGSAIVTGAGTLWVDAGVLNPGDLIFCPDGTLQEVLSFQSNTQLTLAGDGHGNTVYLGATLAGQAYGIVPIGMLPSSLALQVKTTLNAAQAAIGSAVLSTAAQGLTATQQTNARANILALGASDVGKGLLSKSVAGGVEVVLTSAEAANQFIELTGALTASINLVVPAAARLFVIRNSTTGAYTVTVKTAAGTGVTVLQGGRMLIECDGTNCVDALSFMRQTGGSIDGTPIGATTAAAVAATTLSVHGYNGVVSIYRRDNDTYSAGFYSAAGGVTLDLPNVAVATVFDAAGHVGVGVVPSAWLSGGKAVEFDGGSIYGYGLGQLIISQNAFINEAGAWLFKSTGRSSQYMQIDGSHVWYSAASGAAGTGLVWAADATLNADGLTPGLDNGRTLGSGVLRWSTVYAGTGSINTSDAREKTPVRGFTLDEINAAKQLSQEIGAYQFLNAVAAKGDEAREHIGMTVQRAIEILEANNLAPFNYGFICHDAWEAITVDHPAIEAAAAIAAAPSEYATVTSEEVVVVDGVETTITRTKLQETKAAIPAVDAVEAKAVWTETTQTAGDRYGFRLDELLLFIARGIDARLTALEAA